MLSVAQSPLDSITREELTNNYTKEELVNLIVETQHFNDKLFNSSLGAFVIAIILMYFIVRKMTQNKKETVFTVVGAIVVFYLMSFLLTDGILNF